MAINFNYSALQAADAERFEAHKAEFARQNIYTAQELSMLIGIGFTLEQINALPVPLEKSHCDWPYFDKATKTWATGIA